MLKNKTIKRILPAIGLILLTGFKPCKQSYTGLLTQISVGYFTGTMIDEGKCRHNVELQNHFDGTWLLTSQLNQKCAIHGPDIDVYFDLKTTVQTNTSTSGSYAREPSEWINSGGGTFVMYQLATTGQWALVMQGYKDKEQH